MQLDSCQEFFFVSVVRMKVVFDWGAATAQTGNPLAFLNFHLIICVPNFTKKCSVHTQNKCSLIIVNLFICKCREDERCIGSRGKYGPKQEISWIIFKSYHMCT